MTNPAIIATSCKQVDETGKESIAWGAFSDYQNLIKQTLDSSGLSCFLSETIGYAEMEKRIEAEIISRMIHPSSELENSRWIADESSLCEMLFQQKPPRPSSVVQSSPCVIRTERKC